MKITRSNDHNVEVREHMRDGKGSVIVDHVIPEEYMYGKGTLYARVTLKPGCSIGYHQHVGNCETYFALEGSAVYTEEGEETVLNAGDVAHNIEGNSHSIENKGDKDFVMMALVTNVDK